MSMMSPFRFLSDRREFVEARTWRCEYLVQLCKSLLLKRTVRLTSFKTQAARNA